MKIDMLFSEKEMEILSDKSILHTKRRALQNVKLLLEDVKESLADVWQAERLGIGLNGNAFAGKISQGENYLGLPYRILDYPATFAKDDVFAVRTMFWWGHFFSITLHLQGKFLDQCREQISNRLEELINENLFISVGETPWHYHYGTDNYEVLQKEHLNQIEQTPFLKFSQRFDLSEWHRLPEKTADFTRLVVTLIKP